MRNIGILSAALLFNATAFAQSTITIFGIVDVALGSYSTSARDERSRINNPFLINQGTLKQSRTALSSGSYSSSRLGFRGTEDLGGGLAAGFWLEAPLTVDDGGGPATFSRRSTVSLSGPFGELRLGRDFTPTLWNDNVFDPFGNNGSGTSVIYSASLVANSISAIPVGLPDGSTTKGSNYPRASNSLSYWLPPGLGGVYGNVMYALPEKTKYRPGVDTPGDFKVAGNNSRAGRYVGGRLGYSQGPFDVAISRGSSTLGDNYFAGITTSLLTTSLGASYDFGPIKLMGEFARVRTQDNVSTLGTDVVQGQKSFRGGLIGATVPLGAFLLRASYSNVRYDEGSEGLGTAGRPRASQLAVGAIYNLSKRSSIYATAASLRNKNGAALNVTNAPAAFSTGVFTPRASRAFELGIRHVF